MVQERGSSGGAKIPEVTMVFWVLKVLATTLGETAGDAASMSLDLGYLQSTLIFAGLFAAFVLLQIRARRFHPWLYWATIVGVTTLGTTTADFADRSIGIGYPGGTLVLAGLLVSSLAIWRLTLGSVAIATVDRPAAEGFYWATLMFSQTLGTALGDWVTDASGRGYAFAGLVFGALLLLVAAVYFWRPMLATPLFWTAFILTRPLGAVLGDFLDKPISSGGLNLDRFAASGVLTAFLFAGLLFLPQRPAAHGH